ncbi:hypothetical protein SCP_0200200 [Sparassis crispa]|uniref:Uncharacterized protein n=1 Tax=Sparassis crispa TaxID=139825 RepID=A0A401G9L0_9APHY|nr:hypothetical protein SCP_0200200 [Sparassis crispa]GBE78823.1 hypothetical protein SCP_0200200 [Sparassis crispa]
MQEALNRASNNLGSSSNRNPCSLKSIFSTWMPTEPSRSQKTRCCVQSVYFEAGIEVRARRDEDVMVAIDAIVGVDNGITASVNEDAASW